MSCNALPDPTIVVPGGSANMLNTVSDTNHERHSEEQLLRKPLEEDS